MHAIGPLLRRSRLDAGLSQLDLSTRLGVSQRHISYVESGRSKPSRALILSWTRAAGTPPTLRNLALQRGGFAPIAFADPATGTWQPAVLEALTEMLLAHEPFPGIVFDADWIGLALNPAGQRLCAINMAGFWATLEAPQQGLDMIAALIHPGGMFSTMRDPARAGYAWLAQMRAEQWARPALAPRVDALERSLRQRYGDAPEQPGRAPHETFLKMVFDTPIGTLSFLTVQSVVGLPYGIDHGSLRIELWFPTDAATRQALQRED